MSSRVPSAYNVFVKQHFEQAAAAGRKTTLADAAAEWRASGKASGKPSAPRKPAAVCKGVEQSACNAPCAWRTYGAKSKKTPLCYRPRLTTAKKMSMGVAAARAAAPSPTWRVGSGQGPQYPQGW